MSLLMDALKRAEQEKQRPSAEDGDAVQTDHQSAGQASPVLEKETYTPAPDNSGFSFVDEHLQEESDQSKNGPESEMAVAESQTHDDDDADWLFETSTLDLEPVEEKTTQQILQEDITLIENSLPDLLPQTPLDHADHTTDTPLQDYSNQPHATEAVIEPPSNTNSITRSAPLDTSTTHVSAHTVFTANNKRQVSTGLARYGLAGFLLLVTGLGFVALYYSFTTPTSISFPTSFPENANRFDTLPTTPLPANTVKETISGTKDVPTSKEPIDKQDPLLAELIDEMPISEVVPAANSGEVIHIDSLAVVQTPSDTSITTSETTLTLDQHQQPIISQTIGPIDESRSQGATLSLTTNSSGVTETYIQADQPTRIEVPLENSTQAASVIVQAPSSSSSQTKAQITVQTREQNIATTPLAEPLLIEEQGFVQPYETPISDEHYNGSGFSEEAIEVMSAEDFAKGLKTPKSAIKISKAKIGKGHSHKPNHSDLSMAYQAYQSGDLQHAKSLYRRVLSGRPDNRDAHLGLAAIAVRSHNYEKALQHYHYLLQQNPRDQVVNAALFNLQGNATGNVQESQLKLSLDQHPDSPQVHFSLGSFYANQGRWPEAQKAFFDAFSSDTTNADYAYNLAVSLDQIGQSKSALDYYRTALKLSQQSTITFNTSRVIARIQKLSSNHR